MSENSQLGADFVNFIVERVKDVKSPMNLMQICREFKKKSGTSSTDTMLLCRLHRIRYKMSEMEHIDIETKIKMLFAVGAPVSNGFLIELKKQADFELDEHNRIIEYKKHGEGLQLSGVHMTLRSNIDIEKRMLKFLAQTSENATSPMSDRAFLRKFNSSEGILKAENNFQKKYNLLKQQIYLAPEFDQETKIKMLFVSNTKVHTNILEEIRKTAVVEVDEYQRITKYKANDESLVLEGEHKKYCLHPKTKKWSKEEKEKLLSFIAESSKQTTVPLTAKHLSREFVEKNETSRTYQAVGLYIHNKILPKISKLDDFDIVTRMRMLFALGVPADKEFLNKLRKEAIVEVDGHKRITNYKSNNGSFQLETKRSSPLTAWSKEEDKTLLNFLAEKSKQTNVPLFINHLCREFAEKDEVSRTMRAVKLYINKHFLPKISKLDTVDMETKVKMLFALRVSVDEGFLKELRKKAFVEIDKKRRITKYEGKNGSFELTRYRRMPAKTRAERASKESTSEFSEVSEIDEESEDDEDEEDAEEEEYNNENEDDTEDGVKDDVSEPNTKISKKQLSDNHSFWDPDDSSCKSSENVEKLKDSRKEKITRKRRNTYFSETDNESEDKESEGEKQSAAYSSITRSGRISKKRYDSDFSYEFDDVFFDSSKNAENSKIEKETEKLVEKSPNIFSRAPIVKNQKRKIAVNSSDATSPSKKSRKYGRGTDTQDDNETASGMIQNNDREAIYDGPEKPPCLAELPIKQESLLYEEVKLEVEEYKPDLSFLCNTTRDYLPNFAGTEGIRSDDGEQSTENTKEFTSGKEFIKSLNSLLHTLESPILAELQSKVETAIEKLGDGDHKIPTDEIAMTLNTGLIILNKNATINQPTGESTSLRDFLLMLRSTLTFFHSSFLNMFQLKLKETIRKLDGQDKVILLDSIRTVLETLLLLAMP